MDTFHKKDDIDITVGEKSYNLARSFRTSTINELTVIDFEEMFDILWLMLGDNLIKSFEVNVCGILIESDGNGIPSTFRQENIDPLINKWWYDNVSTEIIKINFLLYHFVGFFVVNSRKIFILHIFSP